jgi:UDP-N-acetylglucosamine--N-acetylmuramyl-(pentapeptide) pyrophosphoryl-undecaprenol N-acetylglucosamine transferase
MAPRCRSSCSAAAAGRARSTAPWSALPLLAAYADPPRIVHQTGVDDEAEVRSEYAALYPGDRWEVVPFVDDMASRLAAADLAVCRAGATTLAELAAAGRPAILAPYPRAADDHQTHNADAVAAVGGATVLADRDLDGTTLATTIIGMDADRTSLSDMGSAARALAVPDAADRIADVALSLLGIRTGGGDVL